MVLYCDREYCMFGIDGKCNRASTVLVDELGDELGPGLICHSYEYDEERFLEDHKED